MGWFEKKSKNSFRTITIDNVFTFFQVDTVKTHNANAEKECENEALYNIKIITHLSFKYMLTSFLPKLEIFISHKTHP